MSSQISILQNRVNEQDGRIEELEQHVKKLWDTVIEHAEHIEQLESAVSAMHGLTAIETTKVLGQRVEKLEVALRDVVCCLVDGKVDMAAPAPSELHGHRILGSESVQTMVEVYHRLKA